MKLRYSTDGLNRLIVRKNGESLPIEGEFKIEENNLIFEPSRKSIFTKDLDLPQRIRFEGKWQLTPNRDLKLVLIETDHQVKNDELEIKGRIIEAESDMLIFEANFKKEADIDRITLLRLGGRWQADESNRLTFLVTRDIGEDIIRLSGSWQLNKNQQITYTYEKQDLIRKTKTQEEIGFKGYWQFNSKNRLTYILDLKNSSFFEFKVQMESPILTGKAGELRYRIGIGVQERQSAQLLSIFGTWNINRTKSISFEVDYGEGRIKAITFGARVRLNRDNELVFELTDRMEKDLGFGVQFNRRFFKDNASVFSRLKKIEKDLRLETGLKLLW